MATQAELYQHAINAGATPQEAQLLAAIAMAESGGQSVKSRTDPNSWGPWQVNLDAHPQYSLGSVMEPATAAQAAVAILRTQGPSAWSMYTNGHYQQYLGGEAAGGSPMTQAPIDYADFVNQGGTGGTTNAGGISGTGGSTFRVVDIGGGMSIIMMTTLDFAGRPVEKPLGSPFRSIDATGGMTPYQSAQLGLGYATLGATQQNEAANLAEKMREFNETKAAQDVQFRDRSAIDWQKLNWDNIHADQNLAERKAEFAQTFGLDYDKFQEAKSQFQQTYNLDLAKLAQQGQQFQQSQAQQLSEFNDRLKFDIEGRQADLQARQADLAEKQREFNVSSGLERERLSAEIQQRQEDIAFRREQLSQQMSIASMDNATKLQIANQQAGVEREKIAQSGQQFQQSEAEKKREFDLQFNQALQTKQQELASQRLELLLKGVGNDPMRQALLTEGVGGNIGTTPQEQAVMQIMKQFPLGNTSGLSLQDMAMGGVPAAAVGGPQPQPVPVQPTVQGAPMPLAPQGQLPQAPIPTPQPMASVGGQGAFNPAYAARFAPTQPAHMAQGGRIPEAETGGKPLSKAAEGEVVSQSHLTDNNPPIEKVKSSAVPGGDYTGDVGHSHTTVEGHIHGHDHAWTDQQGQHSGYHVHDTHEHPPVTAEQLSRIVPGENIAPVANMPTHMAYGGHMAMGGAVPAIVGEKGPEAALLPPGSVIEPLHMSTGSSYAAQDRRAKAMYPRMMGDSPMHAAEGLINAGNWQKYYMMYMQQGRPDLAEMTQRAATGLSPYPTTGNQLGTPGASTLGTPGTPEYQRAKIMQAKAQANPAPAVSAPPAGTFPAPVYGLQALGQPYYAPPSPAPYTPTTEEVAKYRAAHPLNAFDIAARNAAMGKGKDMALRPNPTKMNGPTGISSIAPSHMATGGYTVNSTNYYPGQPSPAAPTGTYASGGTTYQRVVYPDGSVHYVNPSAPVPTAPKPTSTGAIPPTTAVAPPASTTAPTPPPLGVYGTTALALRNAQGLGDYNPQRFGGLPSLGTAYGVPVLAPEQMAARFYNLPLPVQELYKSALGIAGLPWEEAQRRITAATPVGVSSLVTNQGVVNPFRYGREAVTYG